MLQVFRGDCARRGRAGNRRPGRANGEELGELRAKIEGQVRYANITIIEGHDASQYGIGIVSARIAEIVLRDEQSAIPIGSYQGVFRRHAFVTEYCGPLRS